MNWQRVGDQRDVLGESLIWDDALNALFWVDIRAPALRRLDWSSGAITTRPMPSLVGSIALGRPGRLLVALGESIHCYDWDAGRLDPVAALPDSQRGLRFNDGRCDRQGRFWVGTMHNEIREPRGALFRLDPGGLTLVRSEVNIPNSLAWSPDGTRMYFADSPRHDIECCDYNTNSGHAGKPRVFARIAPPGFADGSAVDADGFLWNAEFNGGRVVRYAPDGRVDRVIPVPMPQPTCCGFGGPDLDCLFVTSTSQRLSQEELAARPLAGALIMLKPGVRGIVEPRWAGDAA
ncbi:MAG: SMP-30/gluconolactonase/LRE family protein [Rhodospirillales bacterium]|nr:SMP-30/gluconolactonase/LRE family protein [Rhodospirillales bacterium]MDE2199128.1 SMP-30/gluconolactonase/LRE family protein [Rhodospirillales bacterium]MDE2573777.1 SMP-30/gluconolactonase/LRE family protein [Rhodospirillales bacterium]